MFLNHCSAYADPSNLGNVDEPVFMSSDGALCYAIACYFANATDGVAASNGAKFVPYGTVFENLGDTDSETANAKAGIHAYTGGKIELFAPSTYGLNEFRNQGDQQPSNPSPAIWISSGASLSRESFNGATFNNNRGQLIRIRDGTFIDRASSIGWLDGGGNLDVGWDLAGKVTIIVPSATDLSGELGDIRAGGRIYNYSTLRSFSQPGVDLADVVKVKEVGSANGTGDGTLTWTQATTLLQWTAPGDSIGVGVDVSAGGSFILESSTTSMWIEVFVAPSGMPGTDETDTVTIVDGKFVSDDGQIYLERL
jgi:hypothetical protein